ncbi:MAG: SUMF1/EgtB/PvdO family nonheme iron enzyme [Gammaproteobacteria bacterium]
MGPLPRSEPGQLCRHGHRHDQRPWYLPRRGEPFGSEEMSGNVWEWTRSFWGDYPYPERPRDRKRRETLNASRDQGRALRGGGANADPGGVRCVARLVNAPFNHNWLIGFRVVVRPLL